MCNLQAAVQPSMLFHVAHILFYIIKICIIHRGTLRGAGTLEGQGGAAFSKGTFNIISTVITTNIAF